LKTLQGKHLKRWEFGSLLKSDLLDRAVPWTELIFRDRMLINDLNLSLSNRLSVAFVFLFLGLLAAGLWRPLFAALSLAFLAAVLLINLPLYLFFKQRRGFSFMLKAIPWHIIYCVCCGLGFAMGTIRALLGIKPKLFEKMAASKSALRMKKSLRPYSTTPCSPIPSLSGEHFAARSFAARTGRKRANPPPLTGRVCIRMPGDLPCRYLPETFGRK
jgi:hypothetical protein